VVSAAPIRTVPSPDRPKPPRHDPGDGFFMRNLLSPESRVQLVSKGDEDKALNLVWAASRAWARHLVYVSVVGADRTSLMRRSGFA
jgi:hypothetical protein